MTTAQKVSVEPTPETRIPFGAGYDVPTFVARGTVDEQVAQIKLAFGLEKSNAQTLVELSVEAALVAHGLVNAATLGAKSTPAAQNANPEQAQEAAKQEKPARRGIAGKATRKTSLEKQIEGAKTEAELAEVYRANASKITEEQLKLFSARKAAIKEGTN